MSQANAINEPFDTRNPLLRLYAFYVSILAIKLLVMAILTSIQRFKNKAFATPEDAAPQKLKVKVHDNVERVRRAHLNDLENITFFFVASFAYILTNPSIFLATTLFRVYTIARIVHTIVYAVVVIPPPARGIAWFTGYFITIFMATSSIVSFLV